MFVSQECLEFLNMSLILNKDRSVEKVYNSFIKSREESQNLTSNKVRCKKPSKLIPTTGFKF